MKFCLELIRDCLAEALSPLAANLSCDPMNLERFELLPTAETLEEGVLYIVSGDTSLSLPAVPKDSALILLQDTPISPPSSLRFLQYPVGTGLARLLNLISRTFYQYASLEQQLQQTEQDGRSLQQMTDLMLPYFGNSITITNPEFRLLAESHPAALPREALEAMPTTEDKRMPPEFVSFLSLDENYIHASDQRVPFFYEARIFPWRTLCVNIIHLDEFVARICISENLRPFRSYDMELIRLFATYVQRLYHNADPQDQAVFPQGHLAEVVTNLLDGRNIDTWQVQSCLMRLGWVHSQTFACASLLLGGDLQAGRTLYYFTRQINADYPGCFALEREDHIFILINLNLYQDSIECFISTHIESIRDSFFRMGFSQTFPSLSELRPRYIQAELALNIGLARRPDIWLHHFSDHALYYLLLAMTQRLEGKYLAAPELALLAQYDEQNHTELLRTLRVYLEHHMNAVQSATALYIHRATMIYRLSRIKELTKIDFEKPDRILWIMISFRLLELPEH